MLLALKLVLEQCRGGVGQARSKNHVKKLHSILRYAKIHGDLPSLNK